MLHVHYVHNGMEWVKQEEDSLFKDRSEYTSSRFEKISRIQVGEDSLKFAETNPATTVIEVNIGNLQPRLEEDKECHRISEWADF